MYIYIYIHILFVSFLVFPGFYCYILVTFRFGIFRFFVFTYSGVGGMFMFNNMVVLGNMLVFDSMFVFDKMFDVHIVLND